jgi:hypothetical protein
MIARREDLPSGDTARREVMALEALLTLLAVVDPLKAKQAMDVIDSGLTQAAR